MSIHASDDFFSVVQSLKGFMKTGIPSRGLPPLDPLSLDNVGFSLGGANIEFRNVTLGGLSNHDIGEVTYDETKRQTFCQFSLLLKCVHDQDSPPQPRDSKIAIAWEVLPDGKSSEYRGTGLGGSLPVNYGETKNHSFLKFCTEMSTPASPPLEQEKLCRRETK